MSAVPGQAGSRGVRELVAELEVLEFAPHAELSGEVAAAGIEREAAELGAVGLAMAARLVQAALRCRRGDLDAPATVLEIHQWAAQHQDPFLLAASHSTLYAVNPNRDLAAGLEHSVCAVELLDRFDASPVRRILYLMRLGGVLACVKSFDDARERYRQALHLAAASGNVCRQVTLLSNLAEIESDAGEPQRAVQAAERMAVLAAAHGTALDLMNLSHLARAYSGVGRHAEAERILMAALDDDPPAVQSDDRASALSALALAQRQLGALDRARASLQRWQQAADELGQGWHQVYIKREWAALHAAEGNYARAYELHQVFHAESEELHCAEREAQARARQAMYETVEARRQAQLYHDQARRDPLTGLLNRRHIDEHLPAMIEHSARTGDPLVVAMVDLDHFKRINDTCSHEAGDQVLVSVAGLLAAAIPTTVGPDTTSPDTTGFGAPASGFAARLGGEEFLVVLAGGSAAQGVYLLDDLRRVIAAHPWQPTTGDLPVTVSIGVTAAQPDSTQTSLLARADESLYTAKRDGRDRVHVDPTTSLTERRHHRDRRPTSAH